MQKIKALVLSVVLFSSVVLAGVGGKLAGNIHAVDGDTMTGVNVLIAGTPLGTASDSNGEYFIINVPPGTYTVKFQMIGYKIAVHQEVRVISDFTTRLNSVLEPVALDAEEEVIVTATRPLIQRDATATIRVISADDIIAMPVDNFKDVLATQAGFTTDESGGIHVRGGRTKEILYMVDGVIVRDPLEGDFNGTVNQNAIQEMTVISGTFNAEYGQAMSSVVNIVTKEGGTDFHGRLEYTTDQLNPSPYHSPGAFEYLDSEYADVDPNFVYVNLQDSLFYYYNSTPKSFYPRAIIPLLELPIAGRASVSFGGPLYGGVTYFGSAYYSTADSPLMHGIDINQDVQLKLSSRLTNHLKLTGHLHSSNRLYQNYSHSWKYRPNYNTHTLKANDRLSLTMTHTLSEAWFYNIHLSTLATGTKTGVRDFLPEDYSKPTRDNFSFYDSGTRGNYTDNRSVTNSVNLNTTYNANRYHLIKAGLTYAAHDLNIYTEEDPWQGGTQFKDDTTFSPVEYSFFIQDKIELNYLIINLGLRYDHIDPKVGMWEDISRFAVWDSTLQNWVKAPVVTSPPEAKWSPRIGLAYPVTEHTVFHFSYGHFFQSPSFSSMTYNAEQDITAALPLVGNGGVKPQKTVAFEVGVKQALSPITRLTATVWSKDIRDLLSTQYFRIISIPAVIYTNTDYASVKGIDISLDRQFGGYFGANVSYTLSVARGNNSSPTAGYFSAYVQEEVPHKEYYLDFDQRHDLSLNLTMRTGVKQSPAALRQKLFSGLNADLLLNVASGLPYTPYVDPSIRVDVNSARKPWTYSLDLRVKKQLQWGSLKPAFFLEAINLTDHENVLYVNSRTGNPFDQGLSGLVGGGNDMNLNPAKLGPGRSLKLGLSLGW